MNVATPILALSASAMPGDRERAMSSGFMGYITKPIRLADLRREVAKAWPFAAPVPGVLGVRMRPGAQSSALSARRREAMPGAPRAARCATLIFDRTEYSPTREQGGRTGLPGPTSALSRNLPQVL